jgi:hypothetical protein
MKRFVGGACLIMLAVSPALGQLPNVGGGGGNSTSGPVPNAGQSLPNVNQVLPNSQQGLPNVHQTLPNTSSTLPNTRAGSNSNLTLPNTNTQRPLNNGSVTLPNTNTTLQQSGATGRGGLQAPRQNSFTSPSNGNAFLGNNVPVKLDGATNTVAGQAGNLGLAVDTRNNRLRVANIDSGSIAGMAGLKAGDELLAINRNWIKSYDGFVQSLSSSLGTDGRAWLLVNRNGQNQWLNLASTGDGQPRLGIDMMTRDGMVTVSNITQGSAAAIAGLRVGDQIVSMNGKPILKDDDVVAAVSSATKTNGDLLVGIRRNGVEQSLNATIKSTTSTTGNVSSSLSATAESFTSIDADLKDISRMVQADLREPLQTVQDDVASLKQKVAEIPNLARAKLDPAINEANQLTARISDDLNDIESRVSSEAQAKIAHVRDTLNDVQVRLRETTQSTEDRANTFATQARSAAQDKINDASAILQSTREHIGNLETHVADLTKSKIERVRTIAQDLQPKVAQLKENVGTQVGNARDLTQEQFQGLSREVQQLNADIQKAVANATTEVSAEMKAFVNLANQLQADLQSSLNGTVNTNQAGSRGTSRTTAKPILPPTNTRR